MSGTVDHRWFRLVALLALMLAAGAAVGALAGSAWAGLALAAVAALGWQVWRLRRLLHRLASRQRLGDDGAGAWGDVERLLQRRQSAMQQRRRRLVDMLRAWRAAATALPDAVVVVDRLSQRIVWFNAAGTSLLGLRHPRDVGAPVVERVKVSGLPHWLARGRNAEAIEVASPLDPGTTLSLRLVPYSDDLWLLVARDVSRLLQLEQMRRDFVANVSHELRTPLTVLHGYLEMLDPDGQPEWAPALAEMQRQSQRMAQLVDGLLTLSRLESRDAPASEETVPMAGLLAALGREAEALSQGRHAIEVDDAAGLDLHGSPAELHSAFSNLVANAVRHTPEGGRIAVTWNHETDADGQPGAVLRVRDTGVGIAAVHLPRLTERFYRVSDSRSRASGGTGLGLAIVKHVLHRHQARLEVASTVGAGSTFSCHFGAARLRARLPAEQTA